MYCGLWNLFISICYIFLCPTPWHTLKFSWFGFIYFLCPYLCLRSQGLNHFLQFQQYRLSCLFLNKFIRMKHFILPFHLHNLLFTVMVCCSYSTTFYKSLPSILTGSQFFCGILFLHLLPIWKSEFIKILLNPTSNSDFFKIKTLNWIFYWILISSSDLKLGFSWKIFLNIM